jgi:Flp pilus assembly pilin Flp
MKPRETKHGVTPAALWNPVNHLFTAVRVRLRCESGQTMAEYGILLAVIALVVIVVAITLGGSISGLFSKTAHSV